MRNDRFDNFNSERDIPAECGPIAGETPPVAAPAGRGAHRAVVVGVGNASTAGVASRQKFNSADLTWLSAVK